MTDGELPLWAVRLREERIKRLWSQKVMAARLRKAADERTLPLLPAQAAFSDTCAGTRRATTIRVICTGSCTAVCSG
jgi:hypothetical protein